MPDAVTTLFGDGAAAEHAYDLLTVDVPATAWITALETARDRLGCTYFDWLSAVDEPGTGFRVCAHVAAPAPGTVRRLLIRTTVPHDAAVLPTAVGVYAGAAWHERETHEMFGIGFEGHPHLVPLLLPEGFEGHPLRKDFVLAARVAKAWPGAKEPGESEHGGPKRRTMLPPGVPDPNEWGPLKGQLPPAPARPARAARAAGDRPVRRARSVSEGSASQQPETPAPATGTETPPTTATPRRTRSASQGSASQQPSAEPAAATPQPEARKAVEPGAAAPEPATPEADESAAAGPEASKPAAVPGPETDESAASRPEVPKSAAATPEADESAPTQAAPQRRSPDAPWHHARPAFDAPADTPSTDSGTPSDTSGPEPGTSQCPRPSGSGGPEAEPPVREREGRGEAPRPTPDTPDTAPPTDTPGDTRDRDRNRPEPPDQPDTPDHPAGGDTA
ncbi:NADH-quinone oxidoreductase subunit C [Streptomyces sp. JH14]|uniref:NADH-quinone oxidoreductase subunit C n=1 Tax=Streptomyces sp. JH14 TaxID=2793630 RepID=UPI0023F91B2F|nr:NADH-quinone oxidoreductase subunit C [Streptomyces sp. JH14]MDF6044207.1 NADH-quinone oxidoreductase subunit C [Streptomyces sp. JH14]